MAGTNRTLSSALRAFLCFVLVLAVGSFSIESQAQPISTRKTMSTLSINAVRLQTPGRSRSFCPCAGRPSVSFQRCCRCVQRKECKCRTLWWKNPKYRSNPKFRFCVKKCGTRCQGVVKRLCPRAWVLNWMTLAWDQKNKAPIVYLKRYENLGNLEIEGTEQGLDMCNRLVIQGKPIARISNKGSFVCCVYFRLALLISTLRSQTSCSTFLCLESHRCINLLHKVGLHACVVSTYVLFPQV